MTPAILTSPLAATAAFGSLLGAYLFVDGARRPGRWILAFGLLVLLLESLVAA